ncbi:hypothetical protein SAMN04488009_2264 [Maribacter sedimenticola]|uniref:Uncharacterized protein n=1 Tax=Maribacter sedimenticola TaxID=228956 RepID=A0ABY1SHJ5_9FLAO|nr:hypothetical protein [Maribacter sedimenticola]SNR54195.1 hypothetical protein SAMN04488009_2264 [Maribacter sedimenticola]
MRKIVNLTKPKDGIVRLMIYNDEFGTYLFGYKNLEDCGAEWDEWYESENDAMESCETEYGTIKLNWTEIPNPEPNCQHDWKNPVRIKRNVNGNPEFGKLEKLINGKWTEFESTK